MENQIQPFQSDRFGDLVNLPRILDQNKTSTLNATNACKPIIDKIKAQDLTRLPVEALDQADVSLNDIYVKLDTTVKAQKERRTEFTQFFDEVRSLFTTEEKAVETLKEDAKFLRNNIQKEKLRREQERQAEIQKEIDKKNEAIEIRETVGSQILNTISTKLQVQMKVLSEAFYSKRLDEMDGLQEKMEQYTATIDLEKEKIGCITTHHHTSEEYFVIFKEVVNEYSSRLDELFIYLLVKERDRLIELIPSRKMELERIANDTQAAEEANKRIAEEQAETQRKLQEQALEQKEQASSNAETAKLHSLFDTHATASPVIELAKGTSVKKAYKATTHAAHYALLSWWAKNILPTMTIEDLNLKLSFTRTSANKSLNDTGEMIEANGLIIEDDVVTRGRKSKTA